MLTNELLLAGRAETVAIREQIAALVHKCVWLARVIVSRQSQCVTRRARRLRQSRRRRCTSVTSRCAHLPYRPRAPEPPSITAVRRARAQAAVELMRLSAEVDWRLRSPAHMSVAADVQLALSSRAAPLLVGES